MRQMITRLDDELHARLKRRAAEQDRSLNELVTAILTDAVGDQAELLRDRIDRSGLRVYPSRTTLLSVQSRKEIIESLRGTGTTVSDALAADRDGL